MYEVRIHGRGGQGAVSAATMLAAAMLEAGKYAVAIPAFGFERRGAPVVSFVRCSDREIRQMTNIYAPDCLICVDPTLTPRASRAIRAARGSALRCCSGCVASGAPRLSRSWSSRPVPSAAG